MGWIKIIEHVRPKLKDPILIQGLPGLGLVGKLAVDYIIEELKPTKIAELYSDYLFLPDGRSGILVSFEGIGYLPRYEFYAYTNPEGPNDIILLAGDTQPVTWAQYTIAEKVLEYVKQYDVKMIITLGGILTRVAGKQVFAVATDEKLLKQLEVYGVKPSRGGAVTGACGIMIGLAKLYGIDGISLMGSVGEIYPDPEASKAVLEVLIKAFKIPLSLERLDKIIKDMKTKAAIARKLKEYARMLSEERKGKEKKELPGFYV